MDSDPESVLAKEAIKEHVSNRYAYEYAIQCPYRDDRLKEIDSQAYIVKYLDSVDDMPDWFLF